MTFTVDSVIIETGEEPPGRHRLVAVEEGPRGSSPWEILVVYEGGGGNEYRLALLYDADSRDLRLVNRGDLVWTRDDR